MKFGALLAASVLILGGCSTTSDGTTEETLPNASLLNGTRFRVATNWTKIPSNMDDVTDMYIRMVEVEGVCYIQTASVRDWQFALVPTRSNTECPKL